MKLLPVSLILCALVGLGVSACTSDEANGPNPTQQIDAKAKPNHPAPTAAIGGGGPPPAKGGDATSGDKGTKPEGDKADSKDPKAEDKDAAPKEDAKPKGD